MEASALALSTVIHAVASRAIPQLKRGIVIFGQFLDV